jgi:hypothetical protein
MTWATIKAAARHLPVSAKVNQSWKGCVARQIAFCASRQHTFTRAYQRLIGRHFCLCDLDFGIAAQAVAPGGAPQRLAQPAEACGLTAVLSG